MRRLGPVVLGASLLGFLASVSGPASAQDTCARAPESPPDEDVSRARELFVEGNRLAEEGRWEAAHDRFRRAYGLSGTPAALHNAGSALLELGRPRGARDVLDCLLANHPEVDERTTRSVRALRQEATDRVAVLMIRGLPDGRTSTVTVDGRPVGDDGSRPLRVEVDPGAHRLGARAPGRQPFDWSGELAEGERVAIEVELPPAVDPSPEPDDEPETMTIAPTDPSPPDDEGPGLFASPWFWVVTGAVVAGAVATVLVLDSAAQLEPRTDVAHEL